jgi:hypothetical protein
MNEATMPRVTPDWLALREPADAAARSDDLVARFRRQLTPGLPLRIHDLGCGTASMGRWLAPRLPGPQHWIMYDRDADLLDLVATRMVDTAGDGSPITVDTRAGDATRLLAADLTPTSLVTCSAVLDLLTTDEVDRIAAACTDAGCTALLTLSVVGRVELSPADPLDGEIEAAFNDHQRRTVGQRRLLGPDAVEVAVDAFARRGATVLTQPSPWRLGADQLTAEWFEGWLAAAVEQRPDLVVDDYAQRRRSEIADGSLSALVHHADLLAGGRL